MQRKLTFSVGEYYHLYNRGVEKRKIFLKEKDWRRFQRLLFLANDTKPIRFREVEGEPLDSLERKTPLVAIGAYALMPNHFHVLIKEIAESGSSKFMEKLTTGYSMYFNKKYERVGPLFQGRYKGEHIDKDRYLKYLYAYVHLNPIKLIEPAWKNGGVQNRQRVLEYISRYDYTSYKDYSGINREEGLILSKNDFPSYFSKVGDFKQYVGDWLTFKHQFGKGEFGKGGPR